MPQKKFQDIQKKYDASLKKQKDCNEQLTTLQDKDAENQKVIKELQEAKQTLERDSAMKGKSNRELNTLYSKISEANDKLLDKVKELEARNSLRTQELSAELAETQRKLDEKQKELDRKEENLKKKDADLSNLNAQLKKTQEDLDDREKKVNALQTDLKSREEKVSQLQKDLNSREIRVEELESVLNKKDSMVKALKNSISDALGNFKDKGLTVNVKNGKVYVSMDEKLLFESGKYVINATGKQALMQLATALNSQKDVNVLVEGHTDTIPYKSTTIIKDNWDLSVLRATEVTRILNKEGKMDAKRLTAAGRGETQPIATNSTPEGRAKNRRTEIILTPKLDELFKVLEGN